MLHTTSEAYPTVNLKGLLFTNLWTIWQIDGQQTHFQF